MTSRNYRSEDDQIRRRVSDEFYICRKINYGNNGNFVRYAPLYPGVMDKKSLLLRLLNAWRKGTLSI